MLRRNKYYYAFKSVIHHCGINICNKFAIPAINVTSSSTIVATLEAARDAKSPIILQISQGGAANFVRLYLLSFPLVSPFLLLLLVIIHHYKILLPPVFYFIKKEKDHYTLW